MTTQHHEILKIQDPENWEAEMREFAQKLIGEGKAPQFIVHWPAPARLTEEEQAEWLDRQENLNGEGTCDLVELIGDDFVASPCSETKEG